MADKVAFITSGEVFYILDLSIFPFKERYEQGLLNSPIFIDGSNSARATIGSIYDGENFYDPEDTLKENPLLEKSFGYEEDPTVSIFGISEEKVFMMIHMNTSSLESQGVIAGLLSNPIVLDITDQSEVEVGWTWDGQSFNSPLS